ncbi:receptor-like protein 7 [Gossypium hirsutum]|uniref:Receptor-like protein 7 n=1 Tax=Gossypium hirsutum TaxID=3635 RepID=A0ABM2ZIA0_GOSHI|nr:receptor-like protein 7 [Gossypium hirsutum]
MRTLLFSWLLFNSFFAIFFSISNLVLVSGQCQSDQRQLLLELNLSGRFRSTIFATPLGRLMKWNQTKDCCSWEGVSCDAGGHVIGLDLSIRGISSPIDDSSSLFRFQHLQRLNLAFNWFKTSFPTGFDKLENLSYLNLSYSGFKGQIPVEISRLTRLVTRFFCISNF